MKLSLGSLEITNNQNIIIEKIRKVSLFSVSRKYYELSIDKLTVAYRIYDNGNL